MKLNVAPKRTLSDAKPSFVERPRIRILHDLRVEVSSNACHKNILNSQTAALIPAGETSEHQQILHLSDVRISLNDHNVRTVFICVVQIQYE